ncbi:class I SAM-dependent methyltransferase [Algoriphagus sp. CAU 1675]|uniref:class I SAM-dependent methyltransferase n=1 Tax=Algoriphagus sp. CAU 1675 TaxID=3032597 RepID=UPI0023D9BDCF|nr:class I SAM-dependent methyltransferase [Algoriphagus sp. CAU 1675]MDF2159407.1 class I SAM-dependent methyltransferase [Algoriphagus sp. CAU 1675]
MMVDKKYITHSREPFFEIAFKYIKSGSKVLDVGPGNGSFSKFCGRNDFYLLDGNEDTVEILKKNYKNVYFGRIPKIPFEDNKFDLIHCSHIVEHLYPNELYDFLKELDRTLNSGGYLVISTPLFWEGFYNDLSHIKPYNPKVFQKYLCMLKGANPSRKSISTRYEVIELKFRYRNNYDRFNFVNFKRSNLINKFFELIFSRLSKNSFFFLEKTGYTLVLKKHE